MKVGTASVAFTAIGVEQPGTLQVTGERMATTTELRRDTLADTDQDGVPGLLDSAPTIAGIGSADGSFADIQAPGSGDGFSEFYRTRGFTDAAQLMDAILTANQVEGTGNSPLYPPFELIAIAADGGLPADAVVALQEKFSCGPEVRKQCHERCQATYPPPRDQGAGRAFADCVQRCTSIPKCKSKSSTPKGGD